VGRKPGRCRRCKAAVARAATGRRRRYCSARCRVAAYRGRRTRPVHYSSRSCEWSTPPELFARLDARFAFTLDPCATADNARCPRWYTKVDDGLRQEWAGRVFVNPPYGRAIAAWVEKAWEAAQTTAEVVVCLVPARTDTAWWHRWCARGEVEFLPGRLRFGGATCGAPFPSAVVVFRNAKTVTKRSAGGAVERGRDP
jgi:phage N-6-adenine-methyltransferase